MGLIVPIENAGGYAVSIAQRVEDVQTVREKERVEAVAHCAKLAVELAQTDPVKAAACDTAAKDAKLTTYELYGVAKGDGRPAKPVSEEPAGEIGSK